MTTTLGRVELNAIIQGSTAIAARQTIAELEKSRSPTDRFLTDHPRFNPNKIYEIVRDGAAAGFLFQASSTEENARKAIALARQKRAEIARQIRHLRSESQTAAKYFTYFRQTYELDLGGLPA